MENKRENTEAASLNNKPEIEKDNNDDAEDGRRPFDCPSPTTYSPFNFAPYSYFEIGFMPLRLSPISFSPPNSNSPTAQLESNAKESASESDQKNIEKEFAEMTAKHAQNTEEFIDVIKVDPPKRPRQTGNPNGDSGNAAVSRMFKNVYDAYERNNTVQTIRSLEEWQEEYNRALDGK